MSDPSNEITIEALRDRVGALERTVTALLEVLEGGDTISAGEHQKIRRAAREVVEEDVATDEAPPVVVGSPYRGAAPLDLESCTGCGRRLDKDDPEITRANGGRACMACYTRSP